MTDHKVDSHVLHKQMHEWYTNGSGGSTSRTLKGMKRGSRWNLFSIVLTSVVVLTADIRFGTFNQLIDQKGKWTKVWIPSWILSAKISFGRCQWMPQRNFKRSSHPLKD